MAKASTLAGQRLSHLAHVDAEQFEARVRDALVHCDGVVSRAATKLKISPRQLWRWLEKRRHLLAGTGHQSNVALTPRRPEIKPEVALQSIEVLKLPKSATSKLTSNGVELLGDIVELTDTRLQEILGKKLLVRAARQLSTFDMALGTPIPNWEEIKTGNPSPSEASSTVPTEQEMAPVLAPEMTAENSDNAA